MNNGEMVIIQRAGNGWLVRPHVACRPESILVFNEMGYAATDGRECLLGFIERHFGKDDPEDGK